MAVLWFLCCCIHTDELLHILLLLLDVWKDKCWLVWVSHWPGIWSNVGLVQWACHGFAHSEVAMSCPHQYCIKLIPIVVVMGQPALSHTTYDANGFPSHATQDEECYICYRGVISQCICEQLVIGFTILCHDVLQSLPQEIFILLSPDGHFILDIVNGKLEAVVVQQMICCVSLPNWHAVACLHQFLLPGI